MFFLDEIKKNKLSRKKILLPLNDDNKRKGSMVFMMTPNFNSTVNTLHHPLLANKYYLSYYMERSPFYYINSNKEANPSSMVVEEVAIDDYTKENNIYFNGLDFDVDTLMEIITKEKIKYFEKKYHTKINDKITFFINHSKNLQECTNNEVYLLSKSKYDKYIYGNDYSKYVDFMLHILFASIANPKINESLLISQAIVLSGVYDLQKEKSDFPFQNSIRTMCIAIKTYIDLFGEDSFIKDVVLKNNTEKMLIDIFKKKVNMAIKDCFSVTKKKFFAVREQLELDYNNESITENGIYIDDNLFLPITEVESSYDMIFKRSLYKDRIKTNKEMLEKYEEVKTKLPFIKYTYLKIPMYKDLNLIYDLSFYNDLFFRNTNLPVLKIYKVYLDLMDRMINDNRFNNYKKKTVIIPVNDWSRENEKVWMFQDRINPISCIYHSFMVDPQYFKSKFPNLDFLFLGSKSYFIINAKNIDDMNKFKTIFLRNIKLVSDGAVPTDDIDEKENSPKAIAADIIEKIENSQRLNISSITPSAVATKTPIKLNVNISKDVVPTTNSNTTKQNEVPKEIDKYGLKQELVDKVAQASSNANDVDDALDALDDDERVKEILSALASEPDDGPKISAARTSRLLKLQDDFMDKDFKGTKMKDLLSFDPKLENEVIEPISLNVDSVNPEWKELRYANVNEKYNLDKDIVAIFNFFADKKYPLVIKDISVEDTSTSDDAIETYTVVYENQDGKRFNIVIDIPKLIDGKYMVLRGNRKNISSQLFPMPIMKTDQDEVQISSLYNKIFIRRFGSTFGKSNVVTDRLIKTLNKGQFNDIKILKGDNTRICAKYEVPIDYIDLGSNFSEIETKNYIFYFNQDKLRKLYGDKIDLNNGFPIGIGKRSGSIIYYKPNKDNFIFFSTALKYWLEDEIKGFSEVYNDTSTSVKYTFSQATIMASKIPLIVICAYSEGLEKVLKKAGIKYELSEKRPLYDKDQFDVIRWKDGYLKYELDYNSSLLMNGLKVCNTEDYSLDEINHRTTYLSFLDLFGGRIKADGLDNFYELFIDKPITYNTLQYYKLPTDYVSLLLYANQLLTDNKFIKHTNITSSRRIRHNELIADLLYREVLSKAYGEYCTSIKHRGQGTFSVKRNGLINAILLNNTTEDQSIINPLNEYEAYNTVTPKGPGGLNSERAYTLDKRSYDDSMLNVLSMSTSFADKVGIPRQATIDANIDGYRGYVTSNSDDKLDEINPTKTLCMTEALTPYGITRDDPMRSAMNFVQTSKHGMRCRKSDPLLVTTGADEALPYLISNTFAYKASENGKVIEKDDSHMIIEYQNKNGEPTYDYIDLEENVEKNSSSGFYVTLKLDTDLKIGDRVKKGDIVAYDKSSFSNKMGYNDNIAYNIGTLCKFAILNTDEGYEDSAIISKDMSEYMTADIVLKKEVVLSKNANVYNLVKKGQSIKEGDTLLTIQNVADENDTNILLKNLAGSEEEITDLGRRAITSKVTGIVQDIVISRTVEKSELSSTLKKIVDDYEKDINKKKKIMNQYNIHKETELPSTEKLPATGKLKNADDGVLIEFYLKYEDKMSVGDKLVYYSALKGVVKDIFPEGKEPTSQYRPNEKIHSLLSIGSINGRMTCSILINSVINKGLIELSRKVKDILNIPYDENL